MQAVGGQGDVLIHLAARRDPRCICSRSAWEDGVSLRIEFCVEGSVIIGHGRTVQQLYDAALLLALQGVAPAAKGYELDKAVKLLFAVHRGRRIAR